MRETEENWWCLVSSSIWVVSWHWLKSFNHAKKNAQLFDVSWFVHRRWNYKKSVSILKSFKKSINWVMSERCSSKILETTMIWSKNVNPDYCQKERYLEFWTENPYLSFCTTLHSSTCVLIWLQRFWFIHHWMRDVK